MAEQETRTEKPATIDLDQLYADMEDRLMDGYVAACKRPIQSDARPESQADPLVEAGKRLKSKLDAPK